MRVVVTGPEASGTRLMTRILNGVGVDVMHRSMPYEGNRLRHWPTDRDFDGFDPMWLVIMERDPEVTAESQVRAGHVASMEEAQESIREAHRRLNSWRAEHDVAHVRVSYEQLVAQPTRTIGVLCQLLRTPPPTSHEEILDGNAKYR